MQKNFHSLLSPLRPQDPNVLIPLPLDLLLRIGHVGETRHEVLELLDGEFLVRKFPAAEPHGELHEMTLLEEFPRPIRKPIEIVLVGPKAETQHLHFHLLAVRALTPLLLLQLIEVVPELPDLHNRRNRLRRHFDEVELLRLRAFKSRGNRQDFAHTIRYEQHFRYADLLVRARSLLLLFF